MTRDELNDIIAEAWATYDAWCQEHDPDGDMTLEESISAYRKWCDEKGHIAIARLTD